jgi:general secretion pathway protein B
MSLILDALKRAERERRADAGPAPGDVAVPAAGTPRAAPPWRLIVIALVGVAAIAAAVLGYQRFRATPPAVRAAAETAQPAPPPAVIMARPPPPEPAPGVVPGTEDVASLDDLTNEPVLEAEPPPTAPVPAAPPPPAAGPSTNRPAPARKPAPAPAQPAPEPEPQGPASIATTPAPPPTAGTTTSPPAEIPPALTQPAPLRKFREMPPDYRADFPALKVEIHVYERAAERRFVMINGRKYREGERLAEGPALVEIVPDGLVLDYRGEKVLYTLGR